MHINTKEEKIKLIKKTISNKYRNCSYKKVQSLKAACPVSSKCSKSWFFDTKAMWQVLHFVPALLFCSSTFFIFFSFAFPIFFEPCTSSYSESESSLSLPFFPFPFLLFFFFPFSSASLTFGAFPVLFWIKKFRISSSSYDDSLLSFLGLALALAGLSYSFFSAFYYDFY